MAYNTKNVLTDAEGKPIPQFYEPVADIFRQLTGASVDENRYASDHIVWGRTDNGLLYVPLQVDADGQLQVDVLTSALPTDAATQTTLAEVLAKLSADPATQTTLASILAKIIAAPATEAKQDALNAKDFATQTTLAQILAKIIAAPATEAKQDALNAKDFATQTTLASILTKLADPATQTTLAAILAKLTAGIPLSGSKAEVLSAQVSLTAASTTTYNRAVGATEIEIYCESGSIRVSTDGEACTATTGEPLGAQYSKNWAVASVSIYAVSNSVITEVSR